MDEKISEEPYTEELKPATQGRLITGLAALYFAAAQLGLWLALPPGIVTPVWPPSGIALAAMMLFGYSVWPGIFVGALLTNLWASSSQSFLTSLFISVSIAIGSTLQTLTARCILHRLSISKNPFKTYRHTLLFLLVILISCLIGSTIGSLALQIDRLIPESLFRETWLTWWLGDATGMFVFAPFIWIWYTWPSFNEKNFPFVETSQLIALLALTGWLSFGPSISPGYPLEYLLILGIIWAAFRLGPLGLTLTLVIISSIAVLGTAGGYGPFIRAGLTRNESLLLLQTFIAIITAIALIIMSLLHELRSAHTLLQDHAQELEERVQERTTQLQDRTLQLQERTLELQDRTIQLQGKTQELQDRNQNLEKALNELKFVQRRLISQEKLASLGALVAGIAHQIKNPLNFILNFSDLSLGLLSQIQEWLDSIKGEISQQKFDTMTKYLSSLSKDIQKVQQHSKHVDQIVEKMIAHSQGRLGQYERVDVNLLIDQIINLTYYNLRSHDEAFNVKIERYYDDTIGEIEVIPQDLSRAFVNILNNAFYAAYHKKLDMGEEFVPVVSVSTQNLGDAISIVVRDNGTGIPENLRQQLFIPFFTTKPGEGVGFGLSMSYDLIVHHLQGEIKVDSVEGEYAEFTIILPKQAPKAALTST